MADVTFPHVFRDGVRMAISGEQVMANFNALKAVLESLDPDNFSAMVQEAMFSPGDLRLSGTPGDPPSGWVKADGSFVQQSRYAALFAKYGHYYNGGTDPRDGTFKLPDPSGLALVASGFNRVISTSNRRLGEAWGVETQRLSNGHMPAGAPVTNSPSISWGQPGSLGGPGAQVPLINDAAGWSGGSATALALSQPSMAVNVWIKT